jgi:hypothetical protein
MYTEGIPVSKLHQLSADNHSGGRLCNRHIYNTNNHILAVTNIN